MIFFKVIFTQVRMLDEVLFSEFPELLHSYRLRHIFRQSFVDRMKEHVADLRCARFHTSAPAEHFSEFGGLLILSLRAPWLRRGSGVNALRGKHLRAKET